MGGPAAAAASKSSGGGVPSLPSKKAPSFQPAARSPAAVNARFTAAITINSVFSTFADVAGRLRDRELRSGGGF